jgi:hypothetical protein
MCRDDVSNLLAAAAEHCHQLQHLSVRFCPILTYADLQALGRGCPRLKTLNLEAQLNFSELEDATGTVRFITRNIFYPIIILITVGTYRRTKEQVGLIKVWYAEYMLLHQGHLDPGKGNL